MLSPRLEWMLGCCSCSGCEHNGDGQVHVSVDKLSENARRHSLTRGDSLDVTFSSRPFGELAGSDAPGRPLTQRQKSLRDQLKLPHLAIYPSPPNAGAGETEDEKRVKLLEMYRDFVLDLHMGMYLTQLTSSRDYSDIHCQLMQDMLTLKLDQANGRIIEFPLCNVSKMYRIVKSDERWCTASNAPADGANNSEQIVVVEFLRRKLAFVFRELEVSQRFLICFELLIRRAQQEQAKKSMRSLTPTFPPQPRGRPCTTPRQVHDSGSRPPMSAR
mmetsp:Transcript_36733/g.104541  ORF Transcript_36733/g.104541 Transcript_36733/m.104541 type:complete len:273 (-) Transcript_36733:121-939(-)